MRQRKGNIWIGLAIGIMVPIISFFIIKLLFSVLIHFGLMAETTAGISDRRLRTISLLAICMNIIPMQSLRKNYNLASMRGMVLATMLMAVIWIIHFKEIVFSY